MVSPIVCLVSGHIIHEIIVDKKRRTNPIARALRTPTFRQRKVRPKKGRGSYLRARETGRYVAL
jgi:hypothetical protein